MEREQTTGLRERKKQRTRETIVTVTVWWWYYRQHVGGDLDTREAYRLDATYVTRLIEGAQKAIEALPSPAGRT